MKRLILYLTLLSVLPVLTGCQREENVRIQGVYYECIGENEIGLPYNSMAMYGYSSLYYDDRIYISSICDGYNIPTDVFGDEIKTVYGNRDANGLPADIAVYKEGYISFIDRGLDKMIVKADASACENIISD